MGLFEAIVLGITQGITEFLPVSSDGHLIIVPWLAGWERFGLGFDVMLHAGTLLATVLYFRKELAKLAMALLRPRPSTMSDRSLALVLLGATVPSVVVVLALESFVSGVEGRPLEQQVLIAGLGLIATTVLLGGSELIARRRDRVGGKPGGEVAPSEELAPVSWPVALIIGFAQGFAALPGLSRSGTTIATGHALGMQREDAARFSFLLSVPIIAAATAKKLLDVASGAGGLPPLEVTLVGVVVTTVVGYGAIHVLLPFVRRHSLWWFAAYTGFVGTAMLVWILL